MASSYFTINPASGYGNGTVGVTASTENTSQADRYARVSVTNGVEVVPVTVKQLYKPYFIQTGHDLPASGGTISILVHTEYDVVFRGIPSYATMRLNGQTISNDQIIASGTASGATFVLEIPENTSTTPRSVSFYLAHYLNGTRTVTGYISFYQEGATQPVTPATSITINVPTVIYDTDDATVTIGPPDADTDITYTTSDPGVATIDSGGTITVVQDGTVTICAYDNVSELQDCKTIEVHTGAPPDYRSKYLTFEVTSPGNIEWYSSGEEYITIEYRKNNGNWTSVTSSHPGATVTSVVAGDIVEFRGDNPTYYVGGYASTFYGTSCGFIVYGNIMSLIDSTNFRNLTTLSSGNTFVSLFNYCRKLTDASNLILPATTLAGACYQLMFRGCTSLTQTPSLPATTLVGSCYSNMFRDCTSLTSAPELPATTLVNYCYSGMFNGCTSLTTAPELSATTLAEACYYYMFSGCTSLTTAISLPATTLARSCYEGMFYGCTNLTSAPELPATTLASSCYTYMFYGCTRLNYIKCLATEYATNYTNTWVYRVASSGTFVKNPSMTGWTRGISGIPTGWTVVDAT